MGPHVPLPPARDTADGRGRLGARRAALDPDVLRAGGREELGVLRRSDVGGRGRVSEVGLTLDGGGEVGGEDRRNGKYQAQPCGTPCFAGEEVMLLVAWS